MTNTPLYNKCKQCNLEKTLKNKNYAYFSNGLYNINIVGVRSANKEVTNKFDDYLIVEYKDKKNLKRKIWSITTDPGLTYINNPSNKKGTAILVPNQYRGVYKLDLHNGKYKALCQRNGAVQVYRDDNKDSIYDYNPTTIEKGNFGINIHRADASWTRETIDNYSAGCQVFNNPIDFHDFIKLCETSASYYGNKFTYTLINEEDLVLD